jgi:hypothetical protein
MATCDEILQQIEVQWNELVKVRSVFPTMTQDAIGAQHFATALYYWQKGQKVSLAFAQPLTPEAVREVNHIGAWINESYVIRLCALLEYHQILLPKDKGGINKSLDGHAELDLLRRLRNQLVHHAGWYNPTNRQSHKLYEAMIQKFALSPQSPTPTGKYPVHIDKFLEPLTKGCQRYVQGVFQHVHPNTDSVVDAK